jgi:hypothetical protein
VLFDPTSWKHPQLSDGDFVISPRRDDIGAIAKDLVNMVAHHGIGKNIHGKDRGEGFHASTDPFFSMREILSGNPIDTRKKGATDAPLNGMNDTDFARKELINATRPRHDRLQEREETASEKYQSTKLVSADYGWHLLP